MLVLREGSEVKAPLTPAAPVSGTQRNIHTRRRTRSEELDACGRRHVGCHAEVREEVREELGL